MTKKRVFTSEETANFVAALAKTKKLVSAGLLCYDPETRKVLIVMANYKNHWSLPGGICDEGESPEKTAIREAFEEVGISVDNATFVGVERTGNVNEKKQDRLYFIFAAAIAQNTPLALQESEIDKARWVSADELRKLSNDRGSLKIAADWIENGTVQYADFGL